ncbi:hypothetical protein HMPREF0322_04318 [Desulfitobacterium hafniense DP7]|uniref:Uncharacterized protein n=1 Tax=Desulfitobacterium hafniense DP7 TaxID=537010 RepID=G9XTL1_DESHA|nr:hypothetical protein HMPREF0322_04318 [Desulfitobacterium hafniense DP7]
MLNNNSNSFVNIVQVMMGLVTRVEFSLERYTKMIESAKLRQVELA